MSDKGGETDKNSERLARPYTRGDDVWSFSDLPPLSVPWGGEDGGHSVVPQLDKLATAVDVMLLKVVDAEHREAVWAPVLPLHVGQPLLQPLRVVHREPEEQHNNKQQRHIKHRCVRVD